MNAKKCDVCGKFYEKDFRCKYRIYEDQGLCDKTIDLCRECYNKLKYFLENKE